MVDGYMLSERGMTTLKCQMIEKEKKRRPRNLGKGAGTPADSVFDTIESVASGSGDKGDDSLEKGDPDDMDDDDLMPPPTPSGPHKDGDTVKALPDGRPPEAPEGFTVVPKDNGVFILRKRRYRDLKKVGIGGFQAKQRTPSRKTKDDGDASEEKPKKRPACRSKKNKLLLQYPEYIQDSFFGRDIIDACKSETESDKLLVEDDLKVKHEVFDDLENSGNSPFTFSIRLNKGAMEALESLKEREDKERKEKEEAEAKAAEEAKIEAEKAAEEKAKAEKEAQEQDALKASKAEESSSNETEKEKGDKMETDNDAMLDDDMLLPEDMLNDDIFKSIMSGDHASDNALASIGDALDNEEGEGTSESNKQEEGEDKSTGGLADILKLDPKDMEDIFNEMIDNEEESKNTTDNNTLAASTSNEALNANIIPKTESSIQSPSGQQNINHTQIPGQQEASPHMLVGGSQSIPPPSSSGGLSMPNTPLAGMNPQPMMQHPQHNQQGTMIQQNSPSQQQQQQSPMQVSMQSPIPNTPPSQLSGMIPQSPVGQIMSPNHPGMSPNNIQQQQQMFQQQQQLQQQQQQQQQQQVAMQQRQQVLLRQQQLLQQRQQSQQQLMTQQQVLPNPPMPQQQVRPGLIAGGQMPMIQRTIGPNGVVTSTPMAHPAPFAQQPQAALPNNVQSMQAQQQQNFSPTPNSQFQPGFNNGIRPTQTHINMQGPVTTSIQQLQPTAPFSTASPAGIPQQLQVSQQAGTSVAWTPGQGPSTVVQQGQVTQSMHSSAPSNISMTNQVQAPAGAVTQGAPQGAMPGPNTPIQKPQTPVGAVPLSVNISQANTIQTGTPLNVPPGAPGVGKVTPSTTPTPTPPTTPGPSPGTPGFPSQPPKVPTPTDATSGQPGASATPSSNQRNQLAKWESDEPLGDQATIAMILYANQNYPNLKTEYPVWTDRIKQIAKIWKSLPNEKRQPYVQQARENRTASRMNKQVNKHILIMFLNDIIFLYRAFIRCFYFLF